MNATAAPAAGSPVWTAGFRPFFLAAAGFGPAFVIFWYGARLGFWSLPVSGATAGPLHAHELLYGFAAALVCGILLTALPSWTGAAEIRGLPLRVLVALWLCGRIGMQLQGWLPQRLIAVADCALLPLLCLLLARSARGARQRLFAWTALPLAAFTAANFLYHHGVLTGAAGQIRLALKLGVDALMFLFVLYAGLFVPAFTRRWLRARGQASPPMSYAVENLTAVVMAAYAIADLTGAPARWLAPCALAAAATHAWRWSRWRGWRAFGDPLLRCVHIGYLWLIAALLLHAGAGANLSLQQAAVHAFTIGAYSQLKIGLMTRVALKHTGRAVRADTPLQLAFAAMLIAALLRVGHAVVPGSEGLVALSALLWSAALLIYLWRCAPLLVRASRPRSVLPRVCRTG
ncbi:MAG: NnrS family protein [Gammaproteobacteria bacterium]|nr:NnrS family protein [Gammaproteobacteria bacterium]